MTRREWLVLRAWHEWDKGPTLPKRLYDDMLLVGLNPDQERKHYQIYNREDEANG